ncbi:MAG: hypothetical protein JSR33_11180, partial [Proteobacteria bacterium]|nr:hypothetical protein [Pseudomonadota bacterium]
MDHQEKKKSVEEIIRKLNASDVSAFSIMDYFTFDGFLEIRKYLKEHPETILTKTLFPGIELRIDAPIDYRLNIHAIFNENVTDQELDDFINTLMISGLDRSPSQESIIQAAESLPPDKVAEYHDYKRNKRSAFLLGSKTITITKESFKKAVNNLSKEKCLVMLPFDCSDGISRMDWKKHPHAACEFFQMTDIFESRNKDNIDLILNIRNQKNELFIDNFLETMGGKAKPVISGSDAHKLEDYGVFPGEKVTWIKAETTFRGLRKTLIEPQARTFIGD